MNHPVCRSPYRKQKNSDANEPNKSYGTWTVHKNNVQTMKSE